MLRVTLDIRNNSGGLGSRLHKNVNNKYCWIGYAQWPNKQCWKDDKVIWWQNFVNSLEKLYKKRANDLPTYNESQQL